MGVIRGFGVVLLLISVVAFITIAIFHGYTSYEYERDIGSHMDNARDMNTPSRMIEELQLAKQSMIDAGLKDDDYGAWIFKKPSNSMKFQYEHLDSIIERAQAVEEWRQKTYGNESNTQTESLGDVYEQKMDNLREFIVEEVRSDWIAEKSWFIKNHFFFVFWVWIIYSVLIILGILSCVMISEDY
jgi:hypothetical protein